MTTLEAMPSTEAAAASPDDVTLEHLFRRQAELTPETTALIWLRAARRGETVAWTYRQLDQAAEQVARHLTAAGAGPGHRVALCMERSPWLLAALLGTLRGGATYVPLDPAYPTRRLAFMLRDSRAGHLVAQPGQLEDLLESGGLESRWLENATVVELDPARGFGGDLAAEIATGKNTGGATDGAAVSGDHLSHLIYTSGSTGTPKGVAVRHAAAVAMVDWARDTFPARDRAGVLAATSVCFDLSVFELFLPLSTGGTVILAEDVLELAQIGPGDLESHPVTLVNTVPTAITELLHAGALPKTVTTINLAGEPLRRHLVESLYELGHVDHVYNLYGPSEDTTYSTWERVPRGADLPVTIGVALPGTQAEVLGPNLHPVTDGESGELCLAGDGLARGYFQRPAKTAESFVPHPGGGAGERLYRTGDLASRRDDGRLEFHGRLDHQVKLRGFRIELGEIEEALLAHPAVHAAVAHVHNPEAAGGDPVLVAYWVATDADGPGVPIATLETHLGERLPGYMVPGRWMRLEDLPRTPSGKVDRKALPAPSRQRPDVGVSYRAPATDTERFIAELWRELLSIDRVGAEDDLFALGGHSLLATRANVRIRSELGVELPPEAPFLYPTVTELATEVDRRRDGTAELDAPAMPAAQRYPRTGPIPLGFPQEQIWIIHQLRPDNLAYNFQFTVRLHGLLNLGVLEQTLTEVVRRHESLRTTFPAVDGEPAQVVHDPWPVTVPLTDLSGLPEAAKRAEEERLIHQLCRQHFEVTALPLMVWPMLRLDPDEHLYFQVEQHFVHDGWSIGRMMFELEAIYPAYLEGRPHPLPELPVQYPDFALWQRDWMAGPALDHQLDYWREVLADLPPPLEIPTDRPRTPAQTFAGKRLDMDVPPALNAALRETGRHTGHTLFMMMTAAFETLLYRYSGRSDFVLATALANRRQKEFEPLIGMIVNTLVLRADFSPASNEDGSDGAPTFRQMVERVKASTLGLQAHQDIPFERLVSELQPERDLSRNPIYQHGFSFHDAAVPDLEFGGLRGELVERHNGSAKTDLNIVVKPRASQRAGNAPSAEDDVLRVLWEYSTDLFDDATAERQWRHFLGLLASVVEDPETPVDRLSLMAPEERRQVLEEWSPGPADSAEAEAEPLLPRVLRAVAADPQAPAVVMGDTTLTYGDLETRSAALARRLAERGLGPERMVGVCLPASPDLVVAVLSALRAGAAYLPLDPGHPEDRLRYSLEDSEAPLVLTSSDLASGVLAGTGVEAWALDTMDLSEGRDQAAGEDAAEQAAIDLPAAAPSQLAYVIYTSGTTGRPKGTGLTRGGLARLVDWHTSTYELRAADRGTLVASPAFDASVWEIWPHLATGAALHVPPPELRLDPPGLYGWLAEQAITHAFLPTPLAEAMLEGPPPADLALRALLVGGDRLHTPPPRPLPFRLVNHYGPTEDTVVTTAGEVMPPTSARATAAAPSIGRPIDGHTVLLLDQALEPVPAGVGGELWIAGDGLARGYLGRPGLTADRFRPHLLAAEGEAGARVYRTGDLARWRPDGRIDFLGRTDHQVQLRGFRIELGEVEEALLAHPDVAEAVVVIHGEGNGAELVAYWTTPALGTNGDSDAEDLEDFLAQRLPGYMVPRRWMRLEELPLTPTDKVDRDALPDPGRESRTSGEAVAPRNATETTLVEIWSSVLGLAGGKIGVEDGFFALGGHSLAGAKVVARTNAAFGLDLALPDLFENPTVADFARCVDGHRGAAASHASAGPIPRADGDRHAGVTASFDQQRLWLIDRLIPRPSTYHIGRAHRLHGDLEIGALRAALNALGRRHEVLRTTYLERANDGADRDTVTLMQRVAPVEEGRSTLPLPTLDLAALSGEAAAAEEDRVLRAGVEQRFDLTTDTPVRALLVHHGGDAGDHTLLLTFHHIAADGWSLPLAYRDLAEFYAAGRATRSPALPALRVQYADFAAWQRDRLTGERQAVLASFWRRRLAGAPEVLEVPTDRPRPALRSMRGGRAERRLPAALTADLRTLARQRGATLFSVLLAGWGALLGRLAGQDDVVVGSPVAGRHHADLEPLIGFFVNTLPLRLRLEGGGFADLVDRARETTLSAIAHQELPFERLVEAVAPERNLAHSPLYQATLAYQEGEEERLEIAGLDSTAVPVERREAHFELTLFASATADGGLDLTLSYDTDLFDAATVKRWLGYLGRLLVAASEQPNRPLSELPLLEEAERRTLAVDWNDPAAWGDTPWRQTADEDNPATLHQRFLATAAEQPDAVAISGVDGDFTYGELAARSRRLARHLSTLGIGLEDRVGITLPRGGHRLLALLAILQAGGAYVPLDPTYPPARLAHMLEQARVGAIITGEAEDGTAALGNLATRSPGEGGPKPRHWSLASLEADADETDDRDAARPLPAAGPDQLAYVLFTSGSTGTPKAVAVPHRGVLRLVLGAHLARLAGPGKAVLHFAPLSFDASTFEIWAPLLNGGRVAVAPPGPTSLEDLAAFLATEDVTTVWLTAGLFHQMAERHLDALGVDHLLTGGDVVSPKLAAAFLEAHPESTLIDAYGPTENTTFTTTQSVALALEDSAERAIPIGRPIAGTSVHVVGPDLRPVPIGVLGELVTGGDGLARGYAGDPRRTAALFVPDPFAAEGDGGRRLYRTGDRARWLAEGRIDFHGRLDRQVKLRGFRIEPGEVETVLDTAPGVGNCVVTLFGEEDEARLVAYVEAADAETDLEAASLRAFAVERLPDFMVPGDILILDELPLTRQGKVDRKALPEPDARQATSAYVAPRTPTEEAVAAIFGDILGVEQVGANDDFFALGGHSLLATRAITRVRETLGLEIHLRRLFQQPTVANFAADLAKDLEEAEVSGDTGNSREAGETGGAASPAPSGPGPITRVDRSAHRRRSTSTPEAEGRGGAGDGAD